MGFQTGSAAESALVRLVGVIIDYSDCANYDGEMDIRGTVPVKLTFLVHKNTQLHTNL